MIEVPNGQLFLGGEVDPGTHERIDDAEILYDSDSFTTHGVIVGMTGSGKTGLAMIMLEETLLQGIPTLIIDPKGDMGNLLLNFPKFGADKFEPWIDPAQAKADDMTVAQKAEATAAMWKKGLGWWGIEGTRLQALQDAADFAIYTPGSTAGIPVNIIGDMAKPPEGTSPEFVQEEVQSLVTSLLGLVGVDSDPISGREHILLSNIIHHAWTVTRQSLDLGQLIGQIQEPPMRKLGVIELDAFYPADDRMKLALKLNGLAASPSFASWTQGPSLDIQNLLYTADGKPRACIISIAHLNEEERQFVVTVLLSKVITWMRQQGGTSELRALVYMDEVFGYVPPSANPPAKKPILTILKQARAFGVGMVLSTQNPVDLDYKAISNAGTWMIGRLQTERDKARLLEGLTSASGEVDIRQLDDTISGLDKREFLLHSTKVNVPKVFTTRWAMSYLAGPLTRDQVATLMIEKKSAVTAASKGVSQLDAASTTAAPSTTEAASSAALPDDQTSVAPDIADGIDVRYLDPAAEWADKVDATADGTVLRPAIVARINLLFDETKAGLRHQEEWEAVIFPLGTSADADQAIAVDYDDRDLKNNAPSGISYALTDAPLHTKGFFSAAERGLKDHLYRSETLTLFQNKPLKAYSRIGETEEAFESRCRDVADTFVDTEVDKLRAKWAKKYDTAKRGIDTAADRVREAEAKKDGLRGDELLSGVGDLLGGILGGRGRTRGVLGGVRRAATKRRQAAAATERVRTAENRLAEKTEALIGLEADLEENLYEIQDKWESKVAETESLEVGLEKADITVDNLALVWIPQH